MTASVPSTGTWWNFQSIASARSPEAALETSRRVRFLVGAFLFALFAGWALYAWIHSAYVSIGLLLLAAVGPVAYVIGQSLLDAKREEARGRIEAAKLRQKRVVASY